jgi:SagB-type dehydrogenase family enzyme
MEKIRKILQMKSLVLKFSSLPLVHISPRIFLRDDYFSIFLGNMNEDLDFYNSTSLNLSYILRTQKLFNRFEKIEWIKGVYSFHNFFAGKKEIQLPIQFKMNKFLNIMLSRRTRRDFSNRKMNLKELSMFIYFSFNGKKIERIQIDNETINITKRSWPSGGALYPIELWLLIQNVKGIKSGIYFYNFPYHSISLVKCIPKQKQIDILKNLFPIKLLEMLPIEKSSVILFLVGDFIKQKFKYGSRSLRYIFQESGHIAQNFYLVGELMKLKVCSIGGFFDKKINRFLNLNEATKGVVYVLAVGK